MRARLAYAGELQTNTNVRIGSKPRAGYIIFANQDKVRLGASITATAQEIAVREKEVARLLEAADRAESLSAAALEHKKKSRMFTLAQNITRADLIRVV